MGAVHLCDTWINRQLATGLSACLNERCAHCVALILIKIDKERAPITGIAPDFCMGFVPLKFGGPESLAQSIGIQSD